MKKIILLFLLLLIPAALAQVPKINNYVTDKAGVLDSEATTTLEDYLRDVEKETNGVQFVVYIEDEYPKQYSLEEYILLIAEENGIGKKNNDNGILLYLAVKDREYRWEVGYGAESTLNTPLLGRVSREYLVPNFKNGDFQTGIVLGVDAVAKLLLDSQDPDILKLKEPEPSLSKAKIIFIIITIIIFINILAYLARNSKSFKKNNTWPEHYYTGAAGGLFMNNMGKGKGGFGGFGGFSGGGGNFGGGGFSGKF